MKIAIEALGIHYVGGGRTATLNLLEPLFALDTRNEYIVILSQPEPSLATPAGNVRQWIAPFRNRFALRLWAQAALPLRLRGFDLVHFAKNLTVFGVPARSVVTVYDLTTLLHPEVFPAADVWYWRHVEKFALRSADRVIAISQNTARDVERFYQVPCERIRVIYPGIGPHFRPAGPEAAERVRARYGLEGPFIVYVGHLDRKKNLTMLVEAFARVRARMPEVRLVLAGEEYPKTRDLALYPRIAQLGLGDGVVFTGRVPDAMLPGLLSAALIAVFPSLHEGFGLSALEAMACGVPLVTSPAGAVAEVVGDAAVIVDAPGPEAFGDALIRLAEDAERREALRQAGLRRAQQFRREATAEQTLRLYEEVAGR